MSPRTQATLNFGLLLIQAGISICWRILSPTTRPWLFKELKQFLLRGNVVDLAVGVVIGAAFGTVITTGVKDILTPLIAGIAKVPDFSSLAFTLNGSKFMYGDFINSAISFVLVAAAVFFICRKAHERARGTGA